mgnify:CR=1 FL=1
MKLKAKKIWLILVTIFLFSNVIFAQAADEQLGMIIDGSVLTNQSEVSGSTLSNARGTYLAYGNATLTDKGSHVVNVSGFTSCYKTCNEVRVTLRLQRLANGTWTTVTTLGPKSAYNDHYVSRSGNVTVTGGYYYRISGSHTAIKGSTVETTSSSTDGLWIAK